MSDSSTPLLEVRDLAKHFTIGKSRLKKNTRVLRAVDGVSFSVPKGQTLSLVGESGCGKTTTGRLVLHLIEPTSGQVTFDGVPLETLSRNGLRSMRTRMQIIFQDPFSSLNPRMSVRATIEEALKIHNIGTPADRQERVFELLELVGLPAESAGRYPHEFSGGQRQRIGIARALAVEPELIVADEPVSALDVSIQAQILNLLKDLQEKLGLTYLFIGHDLSVVRHFSDQIAVMYLGRIVEIGSVDDVFDNPVHPYTKALLGAIPISHPDQRAKRAVLQGQVPSPIDPPPGCHFSPRCPDATEECRRVEPKAVNVSDDRTVACHVHAPNG